MKKLTFIYLSAGIVLCLILSCTFEKAGSTGSLSLSFPMHQSKTLLPDIDMTPASFTVTGSGPNGATFSITSTRQLAVVSNLAFGSWNVTVEAKNGDNIIIGQGTAPAVVHVGETTPVTVVVTPLDGYGNLDLTVSWNASDPEYPSIEASLLPAAGSAIPLTFTITGGNTGTCTQDDIPAGYYTVVVKLLDGNPVNMTPILVMGAVEVARIVADQTTSGTFNFGRINKPGGTIEVNITPEMADPIEVTLSGQQESISVDGSMTVNTAVPQGTVNVTCVWYINGESRATGNSYTVSGLPLGVYRLDVAVFTTDGKRAGSAGCEFSIMQSIPTPDPGSKIITIGLFGDLETAYTAVFNSAGFKSEFPGVTMLIQSEDFGGHHDRLISQIASGTGANDIEAIEIGYIGYFVTNGGLADLAPTPYNGIDAGKDLAPYCMANATTTDGKLVGLPVDVAPAVLFYRKSIADARGAQFTKLIDGTESCLDTWDEFITEAKKVTVDTDSNGTIDQYALANSFDLAMIPLNGGKGNWLDESGNPYEPEQRFKDVLQLVLKIRDAEIDAHYEQWSSDWIDSLKNGKVVTLYSGAWMEGHFKNWICPELAGDWRVAYIPGHTYSSYGGTYLSIPEQTPADMKALAWEIIKYLCTNPNAQLTSLKVTGAFPALTTVYDDPAMSEPIPYFGGQKAREIFRSIVTNMPPQEVSRWDRKAAEIFDIAIKSVIAGEKTVDQAYMDAKTEMLGLMN